MLGKECVFIRVYKKDIPYMIIFIVLLAYILSKMNLITYARNKFYITEQKYLAKQMINYSSKNNYKCLSSNLYEIYFTEKDENSIPVIYNMLNKYYPHLIINFNMDNSDLNKVKIIIHPTKDSFRDTMGINNESQLPMGIYYAGVINLLSFNEYLIDSTKEIDEDYVLQNGPIIHELTHFLLDQKTNGNFDIWFAEGVALFYEKKYTNFVWREDLADYTHNISLKDLKDGFRNIDEGLAYRKSYEIINEFTIKNGEHALQNYINNLQ